MKRVAINLVALMFLFLPRLASALPVVGGHVDVTASYCASPVPTITSPANGFSTEASSIMVSGTASGEAFPTAMITIYLNNNAVSSVEANGSGNFGISIPLNSGSNKIEATADYKDSCGETAKSSPVYVTRTSPAPPAPTITSPTDGTTTTATSITVTGTAEAGSTVTIYRNNASAGAVTADGSGNFSLDLAINLGRNDIYATATNLTGTSGPSLLVKVFRISPPATCQSVINLTEPSDGSSTAAASIRVSGKHNAGANVQIFVNDTLAANLTASDDCSFGASVGLRVGANTIYARNTSTGASTGTITVTRIVIPPAPPRVITPADGSKTDQAQVQVTGASEPGNTITIRLNGRVVATLTVGADGRFGASINLSIGRNYIVVTASNSVGTASTSLSVTYQPDIAEVLGAVVAPIANSPAVTAAALGAGTVGALALAGALGQGGLLIQYLLTSLLQIFGKNRFKGVGVVYDSVTKKPVPLAKVQLFGPVLQSVITGPDGKFGFQVGPGRYELKVEKAGYKFPGQSGLVKEQADYIGGIIEVGSDQLISVNVPIDPVTAHKARLGLQAVMKTVSWVGLVASVALSIYFYLRYRRIYMLVGALFYSGLLIYNLARRLIKPIMKWGVVINSATSEPVANAVINLYKAKDGSYIDTRRTDERGNYAFFVAPGRYLVRAEAPEYIFRDQVVETDVAHPFVSANLSGQKLAAANQHLRPSSSKT